MYGGYLDPLADPTDLETVFWENARYLESRRSHSWGAYLDEERRTTRSWDPDVEALLRAEMGESGGEIRPRIGASAANQVMGVLADYRVAALPAAFRAHAAAVRLGAPGIGGGAG